MKTQIRIAGIVAAAVLTSCGLCPGQALPAGLGGDEQASTAPASSTAPAATTQPVMGLAKNYPGDAGIEKDPAVIWHEDFEGSLLTIVKKWTQVSNRASALSIATGKADVFGGSQSLKVTAKMGENTGGHLFQRFDKGYDQLYARFMVKFAPDIDYMHHFVTLVAELPAYKWPTGGAGEKPDGAKKFTVGIEPHGLWGKHQPPGAWNFYCYWWKMPVSRDGKHWGAGFDDPYQQAPRGKWQCVEVMVRCNTAGKADGEVALWLDGVPMAHHKGIQWRSDDKLKLNGLWLMSYVTDQTAKTNKTNVVWFDDVVVASSYIGPPLPADAQAAASAAKPATDASQSQEKKPQPMRRATGRAADVMDDVNKRNRELDDMLNQ